MILKLLVLGNGVPMYREKTFNLYVGILVPTPFFTVRRLRSAHISHFFISLVCSCAPESLLQQLLCVFVSGFSDILSHLLSQ